MASLPEDLPRLHLPRPIRQLAMDPTRESRRRPLRPPEDHHQRPTLLTRPVPSSRASPCTACRPAGDSIDVTPIADVPIGAEGRVTEGIVRGAGSGAFPTGAWHASHRVPGNAPEGALGSA